MSHSAKMTTFPALGGIEYILASYRKNVLKRKVNRRSEKINKTEKSHSETTHHTVQRHTETRASLSSANDLVMK